MNRVIMWSLHVLLGLVVLAGINSPSWTTEAFNVETRHYTSYSGANNSMFGFSVAEYRDRHRRGWVIVGAPLAQTAVRNVYRGGAVYRCDVAIDNNCTQLVFDNKEHNMVKTPASYKQLPEYMQIDNKTLQWFGATVSTSQRDGGPILACAPRYTFFGVAPGPNRMNPPDTKEHRATEPAFGNQRDPVGTCFLENEPFNQSSVQEFSPCRTKHYGYHKQGSCQAGFSAALSKSGETLFVGAPGSWYWQGQTYSIASRSDAFPFVPPNFEQYGVYVERVHPGQIYTQRKHGKVMFTKEATKSEDDTYLGYSMATGDFSGTGEIGTAVGNPRGAELKGQIVLFYENMTHIQNIIGEDYMGSYFGYALAAGDIDNDGLDDLIVGAPMYTVLDNSEMNFDTGRIYVYYGKGPKKYTEYVTRDGESNRGRFGTSIAYLGDIDKDSYGDIAVGAPYAGPEGRGAVYIYQGSAKGLLEKYSQVIYGREVDNAMQTFGFSIAGGLDLDNNLYPDMIVGAYESNKAMFFRSRPVIKMVPDDTYVRLISSKKLVSLDVKNCVLSDQNKTPVTCLQLKTCFKYNGVGLQSRYRFKVQYILDSKKTKNPRLCFLEREGDHQLNHTIEVPQNQQYCRTVNVYVVPNILDKLTSLDAEMRMSLEDDLSTDHRTRDSTLSLRPILAITSSRKDSVAILKNCGDDNECTPDLSMTCIPSVTKYLMGSGKTITLEVTVQNNLEDAFEATYYLMLPPGIDYIKYDKIDNTEIPVQCTPLKQLNTYTVKCDIGNPLPRRKIVKFNLSLQPTGIHDEMSSYEFYMETNSSNPEIGTTDDNKRHVSIKMWVDTELVIEGESKPKEVYYNPNNYTSTNATTEIEYGPGFVHNYTIRNRGPSRIEQAEIYLVWQIKTLAGEDFFYLLEQPETSGNLNCSTANSNPLSLKLEQKNRGWREPYSPDNPYTAPGKPTTINEGPSRGGSSRGTSTETGESSSRGTSTETGGGSSRGTSTETGGGFVVTTHETNSTHKVSNGSGGSVIVLEDDWTNDGGIIHSKNVSTTVTEEKVTHYGNTRVEEDERIAYEKRRQEEEEEAKRVRQRPPEYVYGTERHYENSGGSTTHGGSSHEFSHSGGGSVLATGIRTEDRISGDREETIGGSDFGFGVRNVTASEDLDRILSTLTRDSVGYDIYSREGKKYLQFLGRFRVSEDNKEYIEFKDGAMFPLENSYGGQSYSTGRVSDRRFNRMEGSIIITADGKGFVQLQDGRKFPLQGSYSYTEEHTYTRGGGGRQGGSTFSSTSEHRGTTDSYGGSWSEESSNRERDFGREVETHNSRTHEERRTYERKQGSRVYGRDEEIDDPYGDIPAAQYRSGIHKRGSRYRREDDAVSVEDFRKYEKLHRLHKRDTATKEVLPKCDGLNCVHLMCTLGRLEKDEEAWISARFRVKATTLQKIAPQEELKISTYLGSEVTRVPFIGKPANPIINNREIYTILKPNAKTPEPEPVPLWIVVLSACAGVIILLLLIYLLHKCGFFKRNRPTDAPERQPLNRNGHFQGDDHL